MQPSEVRLKHAFNEWHNLLNERVLDATTAQERYSKCTFPIHRVILCALLPRSHEEITSVVLIAQKYKISLYPISTGHNWGYGSSNPPQDGCVIVDLSLMNQILDMDPELGVITVQPGVTQELLSNYLIKNKYPFMVPTTGGGPNCSILGNALERGYGITPYSDHFAAVQSLKAVLPNGLLYESTHSALGMNDISKVYKWGVGPYVDGLFFQANLGIITEMSIALAPIPEQVTMFMFGFEDARLATIVPNIQSILGKLGSNLGGINLISDRRMLSIKGVPYPQEVGTDDIIPQALLEKISKKYNVTPWTAFGAIYGSKAVTRACIKEIKKQFAGQGKRVVFLSQNSLQWLRRIESLLPKFQWVENISDQLHSAEKALGILQGIPNEVTLKQAYWRSKVKLPYDGSLLPDAHKCGLIWFAPLVPMKAKQVTQFVKLAKSICEKHKIEPLIGFTSLSNRCFDCTLPIVFNLNDPEEVKRAQACHDELFTQCKESGFYPYRLDIQLMERFINEENVNRQVIKAIKDTIDPENILSPGRYIK